MLFGKASTQAFHDHQSFESFDNLEGRYCEKYFEIRYT
jgi:hypothetical protein